MIKFDITAADDDNNDNEDNVVVSGSSDNNNFNGKVNDFDTDDDD